MVQIDGRSYIAIDYHPYIADNLSEHGCVIFEQGDFDFQTLKTHLISNYKFENMFVFTINVYDEIEKKLYVYHTFVNDGTVTPFSFFDVIRFSCATLGIRKKSYACDFQSNKIFEVSPTDMFGIDNVYGLKKLLNLSKTRFIIGKFMKWADPPGYSKFYQAPKIFRNEVEREYFNQYGRQKLSQDTFYNFEECLDKFDPATNTLKFSNRTILDFDIDEPNMTIKATSLKAKNLNTKSVTATNELFCDKMKCESVEASKIYAQSIECKQMRVRHLRTNFDYGVRFCEN